VTVRRRIDVVAALIENSRGELLLDRRPPGRPMAGFWEFPGGKCAAGERREAALARELREELGIRIVAAEPFMQLEHGYPELHVTLDIWRVSTYAGTPKALEGQELRWLAKSELAAIELLPADRPIVERILRDESARGSR
jgi:8-oxo-dGTP diphosphatase